MGLPDHPHPENSSTLHEGHFLSSTRGRMWQAWWLQCHSLRPSVGLTDNFQAAGPTPACPCPCSGHVSGEAPVPEGLRETPAMLPTLLAQTQAGSLSRRAGPQSIFCFQFCDWCEWWSCFTPGRTLSAVSCLSCRDKQHLGRGSRPSGTHQWRGGGSKPLSHLMCTYTHVYTRVHMHMHTHPGDSWGSGCPCSTELVNLHGSLVSSAASADA